MGGDRRHRRRRRCFGEDRISSLPDELLHCILVRLGSTHAAVRTSVLSHRWRSTWTHLPELLLECGPDAPLPLPTFLDSVDNALTAVTSAATTLERLCISRSVAYSGIRVPVERVAAWLRFAAERVSGELYLSMPPVFTLLGPVQRFHMEWPVLELPSCGRVKSITLGLEVDWLFRPPSAGLFTALTDLAITCGCIRGSELEALVRTQCPCLRDLKLNNITLADASNVSIRSHSLHSLYFKIYNALQVEIVAPRLEKMSISYPTEIRISAPKLAELGWCGFHYVPERLHFDDISCRLRLLRVIPVIDSIMASMKQQFDEVDELELRILIGHGTTGYQRFLNGTKKLPKCKILNISLVWKDHGLAPVMLHLLGSCNHTKKVSLLLVDLDGYVRSLMVDDIPVSSLEEVAIRSCKSRNEVLEFVELLSKCNTTSLKRLVIDYNNGFSPTLETKAICRNITNMYQPNVEVEFFIVGPAERRERLSIGAL